MRYSKINSLTGLPNLLNFQRISFCWFLAEGLTEELKRFTKIHDFTQTHEYTLYGQEYGLLKSPATLQSTKKYGGSYRAQIVIPIEIRNKQENTVRFFKNYTFIGLPLMTPNATFFLNGCERVVVSQIIRSPGVYFEKVKNQTQKKKPVPKKNLSCDILKLRSFLPSGQASMLDLNLYSARPKLTKSVNSLKFFPTWTQQDLVSYSLSDFKPNQYNVLFRLFFIVKLTKAVASTSDKKLLLKFAFKFWLKNILKKQTYFLSNSEIRYFLTYFNCISKILYVLICKKNENSFTKNYIYQKFLVYFYQLIQLKLNGRFFVSKSLYNYNIDKIEKLQFSFLTQNIVSLQRYFFQYSKNQNYRNLFSTMYFSHSFKDQLRHIYRKTQTKGLQFLTRSQEQDHRYTKSKSRLLEFNVDHPIKTLYNLKYDNLMLHVATIIPEYGSWIRFKIQKIKNLNSYNYPLKHQEHEMTVQIDKFIQQPIISLLHEVGLHDVEIYENLENRDFFYFLRPLVNNSIDGIQPLLRSSLARNYSTKVSEFLKIFDSKYFKMGLVGRLHLNKRLNIDLSDHYQTITYEDIFAIIDLLVKLTVAPIGTDNIDDLKNRRVRCIGELLQNLIQIGFARLERKLKNQVKDEESDMFLDFTAINSTVKEFFNSSQLSQYLDQTNPLAALTHKRRISGLGPGGFERDRVSFSVRDIHPSHYGRICPIETPEGQNVGLIASLASYARINKFGFIETPFWRVNRGKVLKSGRPIYLTSEIEDFYILAPADVIVNEKNYLICTRLLGRYRQEFINVYPNEVDFISISPTQFVSIATSLIPFFEHDDANRALMGSNMQRQSVPLMFPQKPIVGTGFEHPIANNSTMTLNAKFSGIIELVTSTKIIIKNLKGKRFSYNLQKYTRSNQQTCINNSPIIWAGEFVKSGQILTDGPAITGTEMALGQNVLVSYMPWHGYNFEDAILINERLIYDNIFTSIHIKRYKVEIDTSDEILENTTNKIPNLQDFELINLNEDGIIKVGTFVKAGDILVGKTITYDSSEELPEAKLLNAIFGVKTASVKNTSFCLPDGDYGRVIETICFNSNELYLYDFKRIYVFIAQMKKIQVGDKIAGRHGNKGIISRILSRYDMPFLPDGTPIDIILNPLGVPSRMNVGQLYECLLGFAGDKLNCRFKILPFDEMYGAEMSRILINKKLRQASVFKNESWVFNPYAPGKMVLIDGRTGKAFENPITVGNAYMLKLIHLVDDKMHARATGPYSLITQQPLQGKSQQGGQRFGEMEVWALEGYGAAFTLNELLTVKSDDMKGRNDILSAIIRGFKMPKVGVPESFKVLLQELRSIGLDISTYKIEKFSLSRNFQKEVDVVNTGDKNLKMFAVDEEDNENFISKPNTNTNKFTKVPSQRITKKIAKVSDKKDKKKLIDKKSKKKK